MSLVVKIGLMHDYLQPALIGLLARLRPERVAAHVGPRLLRHFQRHLRANGQNARGYPTTHFWTRAADATFWDPSPDGLVISIHQLGVRQRLYGGPIIPQTAGALTIPISPVSYGHRAREFPNTFLLKTQSGCYIVQRTGAPSGEAAPNSTLDTRHSTLATRRRLRSLGGNLKARKPEEAFVFLYKLSPGLTQSPNPAVLPDRPSVLAEVTNGIQAAARPDRS